MIFLAFQFAVLRCVGVFPLPATAPVWKWSLYTVYRISLAALIVTVTASMTVQLFVAPTLTLLARTIDMWTMFLSGMYKWFSMVAGAEDFGRLKTALARIQAQGSNALGADDDAAERFTVAYMKTSERITSWYLFFGLLMAFFLSASPFVTYPQSDRTDFEYFNDVTSYPLSCWMPFVVNDYWVFVVVFMCHSFTIIVVTQIYLCIDSYMFGAIYAVGGQIELLNSSIMNIENNFTAGSSPSNEDQYTRFTEQQQKQCYSILKECTRHHIEIHHYIRNVCKQFSSLIIVDYLHGITSLTFALFQLTMSDGVAESTSVAFFIAMSLTHQFLNNFFGEYIVKKQLSVVQALSHVPWWRANKTVRDTLTLMTTRSNTPTLITGFYMYKLCNASFLMFVKALYTYYMVLRRLNVNE